MEQRSVTKSWLAARTVWRGSCSGSGLKRRDRVAVLLAKGLDVPVSFHGVLAAGGTLVPIDPKSPVEQIVRILQATGATHLVSEPARRDAVQKALGSCPEVSHVVGLESDADVSAECLPWAAVSEAASDRPPDVAVIELDPAYVLHTSGSTGIPKLIQHTHASAMSFVDWAVAEYSLTGDDRLSNHSSHHTCFATFDYYAAARAGATTVVLTPAALMMPGSLSALLEQERVSIWYSVPTALVQLSLRGDLEERDLGAIRWVLFAGETFPEKHLRRIRKLLPGPVSATCTARPRRTCVPIITSQSRERSRGRCQSEKHARTRPHSSSTTSCAPYLTVRMASCSSGARR